MRQLLNLFATCAAIGITTASSPAFSTDESLQRCLIRQAEQADFSGVIAISRGDHELARVTRGRLEGVDSAVIGEHTRFNLGSASKMFTAVAIGQLVDARKVQLDDQVGKFVSGLTPEAAQVTVRQLLTHSSGLGDFFKPKNMAAMMRARTASDILPLIAEDRPGFPPGSQFVYSNSGFALLGILIERVSGQSYGDYLVAHLFGPAGMTETGLDPRPLSTLAVGMTEMHPSMPASGGAASSGLVLIGPEGRRVGPGAVRQPSGPSGRSVGSVEPEKAWPGIASETLHPAPGAKEGYGSPAGGLFSTASDMQRFAKALLENRLTRPETTAALTTKQIIAQPGSTMRPERDYGFGFGVGTEAGQRWFGHNGGTLGANTEFAVFPELQLTVVVLSNRDPPSASKFFAYARDLLFQPGLVSHCM